MIADTTGERKPRHGWIPTTSGLDFFPLNPEPKKITIEDIAHSLAGMPRFNGHCDPWYTVAQHCVLVSLQCEDELGGLLHDAHEALTGWGDIASPVKRILNEHTGGLIRKIERKIDHAIGVALGVDDDRFRCPEVKHADLVLLATEKRDVLAPEPWPWHPLPDPLPRRIMPWARPVAEETFLRRYRRLTR